MSIEEIKEQHTEGVQEMAADIEKAKKQLGADHSLVQKMKTIYETLESFTVSEMVLFEKIVGEDDQS